MSKAVETYRRTGVEYEELLKQIEQLTSAYNQTANSDPAQAANIYRELAQLHSTSQQLHSKLTGIRTGLSDLQTVLR